MIQNRNGPEDSLKDLKDYFSRALAADATFSERSILFFIKRKLFQHNLSDFLAVEDVLHEAFIRTERSIRADTIIDNIPGWINRVCLNIIREHSRKAKANQNLHQKARINLETFGTFIKSESFIELHIEDINSLSTAWENLSPSEQKILELKHVKKHPWKEISDDLSASENKIVSPATARKRGERALSKLKLAFSRVMIDKH